ncbi:glycoside hydrolase superfamily [Butyriboletus roseoflavus]|nr:glycoside hydrolase superfamily [Butyriboletus roseoflavus]
MLPTTWKTGSYRYGFNAVITTQDLSEYYLPSFQSCYRDAKVGAAICSYNAVNVVPSCADTCLLQDILRDFWGFAQDRWIASNCDAIANIYDPHDYTASPQQAVADALMTGADIDCGTFYSEWLPTAYSESLITETQLRTALTHQYALGYFDPIEWQPYRTYNWNKVNTPEAQQLAYQAAVKGIVLLKNDGTLPLASSVKNIAFIGPWADATFKCRATKRVSYPTSSALSWERCATDTTSPTCSQPQQEADAVSYAGGIDLTIEAEYNDRLDITWPGNQLELIAELQAVGNPLVVAQSGGGQLDDTMLKANTFMGIYSIRWTKFVDYRHLNRSMHLYGPDTPVRVEDRHCLTFLVARSHLVDVSQLLNTRPTTSTEIPMIDMNLRPNATSPGRTYKW